MLITESVITEICKFCKLLHLVDVYSTPNTNDVRGKAVEHFKEQKYNASEEIHFSFTRVKKDQGNCKPKRFLKS